MVSVDKDIAELLEHERRLWAAGHGALAGVDEAGRGPLAGPVVAAAVILPRVPAALARLQGLRDSKLLTPRHRDRLFPIIREVAVGYGLGLATPPVIDGINVHQATCLAMRRALDCLGGADYVLVDGPWRIPQLRVPQEPLVRGDDRSLSIAAASVLAKVFRDRLMVALGERYPDYSFHANKGYPTGVHRRAILDRGLTPQHRLSFCRRLLAEREGSQ